MLRKTMIGFLTALALLPVAYCETAWWSKPAGHTWIDGSPMEEKSLFETGTGEGVCVWEHFLPPLWHPRCYLSFVVIADIHARYPRLGAPEYPHDLEDVIAWIERWKNHYKIAFVVLLGDITDQGRGGWGPNPYDEGKSYEALLPILDRLTIPWIPVMGNHDIFLEPKSAHGTMPEGYSCENCFDEKLAGWWQNVLDQKFGTGWSTDGSGNWRGSYDIQYAGNTYRFTNGGFELPFNWFEHCGHRLHARAETWHFTHLDFCTRWWTPWGTDYAVGEADLHDWGRGNAPNCGTFPWLVEYELDRITENHFARNTVLLSHHPPCRLDVFGFPTNVPMSFMECELQRLKGGLTSFEHLLSLWISGHLHFPLEPGFHDVRKAFAVTAYEWLDNFRSTKQWTADNFGPLDDIYTPPNGRFVLVQFKQGASSPRPDDVRVDKKIQPIVYPWHSSAFQEDNSVLPSSQCGFAWDDFYKLEVSPELKDGLYTLRIYGNEEGIGYLEELRLMVIDHPDTTVIGSTPYGRIVHHFDMIKPVTAVNNVGENVLSLLESLDSTYVQMSPDDWIELNFGALSDSGYIDLYTAGQDECLPQLIILNGDTLASVFPREKECMNFVEFIPCTSGGDAIVRVMANADSGMAKIDQVNYSTSAPNANIAVRNCPLIKATHTDTTTGAIKTVTRELAHLDNIKTKVCPGEYWELTFQPPDSSLPSGWVRDFVLRSVGECVLDLPQYTWRVKLSASADFCADGDNYVGVEYVATEGFDGGYDKPEPLTPPSPYLQLYFSHPEWKHRLGDKFCHDIKDNVDLSDATMTFDFEIDTDQSDEDITVAISPADVDTGYGIYLLDIEDNFTQNMRTDSTYTYNSEAGGIREFQLIVGQYARNLLPGWALISVPFIPDEPDPDSVFKDCGANYWMYEYAHLSGYAIPDSIVNAHGYWFSADSAVTLNTSGTTPPGSVSVALTQGWNLIGDPFNEPVGLYDLKIVKGSDTFDIASAADSEWVSPVLYGYSPDSNSYTVSDFLNPWCGYWFTAIEDSLELLSMRTTVGAKSDAESYALQQQTIDNWSSAVVVSSEGISDDLTTLGTSLDVTDGFDAKHDWFEPPVTPEKKGIEAYFSRETWKPDIGTRFSRDIRSPIQDGKTKTWEFDVGHEEAAGKAGNRVTTVRRALTERKTEVTLSWPDTEGLPDGLLLTLVDKQNGTKTDMRSTENYTYQHIRGRTCQFEIEVTCQEGARGPAHIWKLHQNRPNPFLRNTLISYSVAAKSHVSLKLYDVSGRMVKTFVDAHMKPGSHSIRWDSKNMSSGVYFMKFKAERFKDTKKMVIL